ncbi:MAG TPA: regulatory protein RecX [Gemmatimonadaceae bacterium]|nr:regulatory protein RecX [Gemmatimonadaceae bacterium]
MITAIVPETRREGRLAILVDGQPAAIVALDDVERLGLRVGATIDPTILSEADADCALYDRAVRLLAARSRSATELRRRLRRDGAAPDRVERILAALTARGFVDDAAHARTVTRSRVRSRGTSARRIEQELRRQGVAADIATEAVDEVFADEAIDEAAVAMEVARKRASQLTDLPAPVQRRRLYGYLARRGYSPDIVRRTVDAVLK